MEKGREDIFQKNIIEELLRDGWLIGESSEYDKKRALYPEDVIGFVQETQPEQWEMFQKLYPNDTEKALLNNVEKQHPKPIHTQPAGRQDDTEHWVFCGTKLKIEVPKSGFANSNRTMI